MATCLKKNKKAAFIGISKPFSVKKIIIQMPSVPFNFYQSFAGIIFT
jgi:hypothetical protein